MFARNLKFDEAANSYIDVKVFVKSNKMSDYIAS